MFADVDDDDNDEEEDDDAEDKGEEDVMATHHDIIGPSQLQDTPTIQPSQLTHIDRAHVTPIL
jgi:hypothetical protein